MIRVFFSKIILPLPFFALLILTGAFAFYFKKKRTGKVLFIVGIAGLFLFSFHWIPDFMAGTLENRYTSIASEALQNQENPDIPVWVLGGGHTYDNRLSATSQLSSHALGRLSEALRVMNLTGSQQLLVSGGSSTGQKTQAEILREAAISMGVNKGNITIIPEPLNTREEALHAARIFSSDQPFILVTDAIHMPRAMQQFQKQGLKPIPAPCNFMVKKADVNPPLWWFPSSKNIEKAESTIHEYVGMLWYKLGGG